LCYITTLFSYKIHIASSGGGIAIDELEKICTETTVDYFDGLAEYLPTRTEGNNEVPVKITGPRETKYLAQDNWSLGRDSNLGPPGNEVGSDIHSTTTLV
jgi:hypothetical protein